jgi:hypothetical protein
VVCWVERTKKAVAPSPTTHTQADIFFFSGAAWGFGDCAVGCCDVGTGTDIRVCASFAMFAVSLSERKWIDAEDAVTPGADWARNLGTRRAH